LEDSQKTIDLHNMLTLILVIVLAVVVAIAVFFARYISGLISKPLSLMAGILTQIGVRGDLELPPEIAKQADDEAKREDEIGVCAKAFIELIKHLTSVNQALASVAGGDLTVNVTKLSERDSMGSSLAGMVDNLGKMFISIHRQVRFRPVRSRWRRPHRSWLPAPANRQRVSRSFPPPLPVVNEVTAACGEQTKSINEINRGMEQISIVVQSNSATAEQSAAASQQMSAQAVLLGEIVARFKLKGGERTLTRRNKALSDGFALPDAESGEGGKY